MYLNSVMGRKQHRCSACGEGYVCHVCEKGMKFVVYSYMNMNKRSHWRHQVQMEEGNHSIC